MKKGRSLKSCSVEKKTARNFELEKKFQNFHSCSAIFATTTSIAQNVMVLTSILKNAVFRFVDLCIDMRLGRDNLGG